MLSLCISQRPPRNIVRENRFATPGLTCTSATSNVCEDVDCALAAVNRSAASPIAANARVMSSASLWECAGSQFCQTETLMITSRLQQLTKNVRSHFQPVLPEVEEHEQRVVFTPRAFRIGH